MCSRRKRLARVKCDPAAKRRRRFAAGSHLTLARRLRREQEPSKSTEVANEKQLIPNTNFPPYAAYKDRYSHRPGVRPIRIQNDTAWFHNYGRAWSQWRKSHPDCPYYP